MPVARRASRTPPPFAAERRRAVIETARAAGLLGGESGRVGARIRRRLLDVAKARAGVASDTELLEYALARVALEDDFGPRLLALKGSVAADLDLEF